LKTPCFSYGDEKMTAPQAGIVDLYTVVCYHINMKQKRAYKYRCYPTHEQKQVLAHTFGCARFVYNWLRHEVTCVAVETG
jgi:hypothetical protein